MIKLSCKSCGAKLELTDDIDRFSCASCGSEWLVNRGGGIISLKAVEEKLEKIEQSAVGTEKNTEILANQVKLDAIKKKLLELSAEIGRFSLNCTKLNPKYREPGLGPVGYIGFFICMAPFLIIPMVLYSTDISANLTPYWTIGIILFLIGAATMATTVQLEPSPEFIPDVEMNKHNKQKLALLDEQINELLKEGKKIEDSLLPDIDILKESIVKKDSAPAQKNINSKNMSIHEACEAGELVRVKELVEKGASLSYKNSDGKMPLTLAKERGHQEIVAVLTQAGAVE